MSSNYNTITLYIDNMTCVNCENIIEKLLTKMEGIVEVKASYNNGTAIVTYDPRLIGIKSMEEALQQEDYHVVKQDSSEAVRLLNQSQASEENRKQEFNIPSTKAPKNGFDFTDLLAMLVILFAFYVLANRFGLFNIFNAFPVAKEGMSYGMLFLIGLLTSVHCVAMCGGICLSQCVPKNTENKQNEVTSKLSTLRPSILYNMGRVISYTLIGGIVGAIGSVVSFSGSMKGFVQLLAGVFMIIMGINMLNLFPWLRKFNPRMPKVFAKKIYAQRGNNNSPLYIGILNGLMPCGPLQAMQLYALSTGSPFKGALSMFLFSVGTVPLMFVFGALGSYLNKKFTAKMMTVSAVLVVILGLFMFNNGISLSGIALPSISANQSQNTNIASVQEDIQTITTSLSSGRYEPITVQKGIPVKWTIQAEAGDINGCNNSIIIPKYNIQKNLSVGDNVIEFTPTESGVIPFSCWMGMIRSKITVVDDLNEVDQNVTEEGNDTTDSSTTGIDTYNNLSNVKIPTDEIAIAKIEDGVQKVDITFDQNGFSPAVVVLQSDMETVWNINAKGIETNKTNLIFPYYGAQLEVVEGNNPINFYPDQDFDFMTEDATYYGYVKVVEDINQIDIEAIKAEVSQYQPSDPNIGGFGSGASCH